MKLVILFLCLFPVFVLAQSPGGVRPNLQVWLKATDGVMSDANPAADKQLVTAWRDLSGVRDRPATAKGVNFYFSNSNPFVNPPTFRANASDNINYNPVIDFDGDRDALNFRNDFIFSSGSGRQNGMTWLAVVQPDATVDKPQQFIFDFGAVPGKGYGLTYGSSHYSIHTPTRHGGAFSKSTPHHFNTQTVLVNFTIRFKQTQTFAVNGGKPLVTTPSGVLRN